MRNRQSTTTCRRGVQRTASLKEVDLFVMVKKTHVVLPQYERSAGCSGREPEHIPHFPPFLLCHNLHFQIPPGLELLKRVPIVLISIFTNNK